ncbi:MAG TPA: hypothetical protein PKA49_02490 [Tepidiformaceae bacterium]|nr:hypothetical protein [Tepidiformaceae bacterium]
MTIERGREEQHLPFRADAIQDALDLGHEAEVGHLIRLVEHCHLHFGDGEGATFEQVVEAAGSGNDDVDTHMKGADLAVKRNAAVNGVDALIADGRHRRDGPRDLHRELPRRDEDERGRVAGPALAAASEHGDAEGERLARTGARLAADIAAGESIGDGEELDRRRLGDARSREHLHHGGCDAERSESGFIGSGGRGFRHGVRGCLRRRLGRARGMRGQGKQKSFSRV